MPCPPKNYRNDHIINWKHYPKKGRKRQDSGEPMLDSIMICEYYILYICILFFKETVTEEGNFENELILILLLLFSEKMMGLQKK